MSDLNKKLGGSVEDFITQYQKDLESSSQSDSSELPDRSKLDLIAERLKSVGEEIGHGTQDNRNETGEKIGESQSFKIYHDFPVPMRQLKIITQYIDILNKEINSLSQEEIRDHNFSDIRVSKSKVEKLKANQIKIDLANALGVDIDDLKYLLQVPEEPKSIEPAIPKGLSEIKNEIGKKQSPYDRRSRTAEEQSGILSFKQLLAEMKKRSESSINEQLKNKLIQTFDNIKQKREEKQREFDDYVAAENRVHGADCNKTTADAIFNWAKSKARKLGKTIEAIEETIAVMDLAYELLTGNRLRDTQILATLLFLENDVR